MDTDQYLFTTNVGQLDRFNLIYIETDSVNCIMVVPYKFLLQLICVYPHNRGDRMICFTKAAVYKIVAYILGV